MAQLGVIELVVLEPARADRAKAILERVERAFVDAEARRSAAARLAFGVSHEREPTDEEIREAFRTMDEVAREAFAEYISAQLELRAVLLPAEFEKLTKVR